MSFYNKNRLNVLSSNEIAESILNNSANGAFFQATQIAGDGIALRFQDRDISHMLRQYNQELINQGFGIRRTNLRKKDFIDVRDILPKVNEPFQCPNPTLTKEEKMWGKENYWYSIVPCFTEGVLQINDSRYIYWNLKEIKPYDNEMTILLHDYAFYPESGWNPGVSGVGVFYFNEKSEDINDYIYHDTYIRIDEDADEFQLLSDIYTMLNYKKTLGWNQKQIDDWKDIVVGFAKKADEENREKNTNSVKLLFKLFSHYIVKVNYMLAKNKPVTKREHTKTVTSETKIEAIGGGINKDETLVDNRRVRTVGKMSVTSSDIPRVPTEKTIIRYKVACWKTRGFIRTLKDGRKIPVKESVHYRQCLKESANETPVTIKLKDSGGNKGDSNE